jgi:hypothetical protein
MKGIDFRTTLQRSNAMNRTKLIRKRQRFEYLLLVISALFLVTSAEASPGDFYTSTEAKVVGHLSLPGNPARQMFVQQIGRKDYLYVRQSSRSGFTVVDVTKPQKPRVVSHVSQGDLTLLNSGLALSETPEKSTNAKLSRSIRDQSTGSGASNVPESVRLLNMGDPVHPRTLETFDGVTSIARDDARSLLYVANAGGIWIVSHKQVLRRHLCDSSDAISSAIPNCD